MGAGPSTARRRGIVERAGSGARRKCAALPRYADVRGFALSVVYGVPSGNLDMYPPSVYSKAQAEKDIQACALGLRLPFRDRVVRYDRVAGSRDPRVYALMKFHGYKRADFEDGQVLRLLPYSVKDAQIDIAYFARRGVPYYKVIKQTSTVLDHKRSTYRDWRHKGFDDRYKYDAYDPNASKQKLRVLSDRASKKLDASKYPRRLMGSQWVRIVPCSAMPAMCGPGMDTFPYPESADRSGAGGRSVTEAAWQASRKAKLAARRRNVEHSKRMGRLAAKMRGLNRESDEYKRLAALRRNARVARRMPAATGGKPPNRRPVAAGGNGSRTNNRRGPNVATAA